MAVLIAATLAVFTPLAKANEIQLNQFMVETPKGRQAVTLYIGTTGRNASVQACRYAPKLRDSVLGELNRAPAPLTPKGGVDLDKLQSRLKPVVLRALPPNLADGVRLVHGVPRLSSFAAKSLARIGCTIAD